MTAPVLVIGVGNPSRGDDAAGPLVASGLAALHLPGVEVMEEFQLQVEHALDVAGRRLAVFVDASVTAEPPFELVPVMPAADASWTTHALSPAAVLETCRLVAVHPPPAWLLAVRAERFELGDPPSDELRARCVAALREVVALIAREMETLTRGTTPIAVTKTG